MGAILGRGAAPRLIRELSPTGVDRPVIGLTGEGSGPWRLFKRKTGLRDGALSLDGFADVSLHLKRFPAAPGERVGMPSGLDGWAMVITQPPRARAPRAISGLIVLHGRVLIATVTADDLAWATSVWRSIRWHPDPVPRR